MTYIVHFFTQLHPASNAVREGQETRQFGTPLQIDRETCIIDGVRLVSLSTVHRNRPSVLHIRPAYRSVGQFVTVLQIAEFLAPRLLHWFPTASNYWRGVEL